MAGLLALLGPAGRVSARVRPRAAWLLSAAAPCAPPSPLRPGPDPPLVRAVHGDDRGRQESPGAGTQPWQGFRTTEGWMASAEEENDKTETGKSFGEWQPVKDPSKLTETVGSKVSDTEKQQQSKSQQLRKIFKEYGAVGVSFHVGISLVSLGIFYTVVSSGVDMSALLLKLGFQESLVQSKMAAGTSTFVVAYAIHKLFAPVRMSITVVSVPLIVRHLRKVGFFKPPAANP